MAVNSYHDKPEWIQYCDRDGNIVTPDDITEDDLYPAIHIDRVDTYAYKRVIPYDSNSPLLRCAKKGIKVHLGEESLLHPTNPNTGESLGRVFAMIQDSEEYCICVYKKKDVPDCRLMIYDFAKLNPSLYEEVMEWAYLKDSGVIPAKANVTQRGFICTEKLMVFPKEDLEKVAKEPYVSITIDNFKYPECGEEVLLDKLEIVSNVAFAPLKKNPNWYVIVHTLSDYKGIIGTTIDLIGHVDKYDKLPCIGPSPIVGVVSSELRDKVLPAFQTISTNMIKNGFPMILGCIERVKDEWIVFLTSMPKTVKIELQESGVPKLIFPHQRFSNVHPTDDPRFQRIEIGSDMSIRPLTEITFEDRESFADVMKTINAENGTDSAPAKSKDE